MANLRIEFSDRAQGFTVEPLEDGLAPPVQGHQGVYFRMVRGENRERMKRHLPEEYDRRPIVETVHSVIKSRSGSYARSKIPGQLEKEMALKIIAYNIGRIIMVNNSKFIFIIEDFYRAAAILFKYLVLLVTLQLRPPLFSATDFG